MLYTRTVVGTPTSGYHCSSELIRLKSGNDHSLRCGSHCDDIHGAADKDTYLWWKLKDKEIREEVSGGEGGELTWSPVSAENGGQYVCRCQNGRDCLYNVTGEYVKPSQAFRPQDTFYLLVLSLSHV